MTTPKTHLKTLKAIVELLERHSLDFIEFNGIKVARARHVSRSMQTAVSGSKKEETSADAFRAPLTVEDLDALNRGLL